MICHFLKDFSSSTWRPGRRRAGWKERKWLRGAYSGAKGEDGAGA